MRTALSRIIRETKGIERAREISCLLGYGKARGQVFLEGIGSSHLVATGNGLGVLYVEWEMEDASLIPLALRAVERDRGTYLLFLEGAGGICLAWRGDEGVSLLRVGESAVPRLCMLRPENLPQGLSSAFDARRTRKAFAKSLAAAITQTEKDPWLVPGFLFLIFLGESEGDPYWLSEDSVTREGISRALRALASGGEVWPGGPVAAPGVLGTEGAGFQDALRGSVESLRSLTGYPYTLREGVSPGVREVGVSPGALGLAYEMMLGGTRRTRGSYFTPFPVADFMVREALSSLSPAHHNDIRLVDPAAGPGVFLVAAVRAMAALDRGSRQGLLGKLYGVDADPRALEIARMRLILASREKGQGLDAYPEGHLVAGDSLELGPFRWREAFPDAFRRGGFPVVIGNPPYLFGEDKKGLASGHRAFRLARGQFDVAWLFWEKAVQEVVAPEGVVSFLSSDGILIRDESERLRRFLLEETTPESLGRAGAVFSASVAGTFVRTRKARCPGGVVQVWAMEGETFQEEARVPLRVFRQDPRSRFLADGGLHVLEAMRGAGGTVGAYYRVSRGEEIGRRSLSGGKGLPVLAGRDVRRLALPEPSLEMRPEMVRKDPSIYRAPKVVLVKTGRLLRATLDYQGITTLQSVYNIHAKGDYSLEFLVGLLASKALNFYVAKIYTAPKAIFPQLNQSTVLEIPLPGVGSRSIEDRVADLYGQGVEWDDTLDAIVFDVFALKAHERDEVERYFAGL